MKDIDKLDDFADVLRDSIKQNAKINVSDGLDQNELFEAMNDLNRNSAKKV